MTHHFDTSKAISDVINSDPARAIFHTGLPTRKEVFGVPVSPYMSLEAREALSGSDLFIWDLGRIRYFAERLQAGKHNDPPVIRTGPRPFYRKHIQDGHHRIIAAHFAGRSIAVRYI